MFPNKREFHMETCPKRSLVDSALVEQDTDKGNIAPPLPRSVVQLLLPEGEESWDDINVPTYVPDLSTRNMVQTLKNAPYAKKREFQRLERIRLLDLQDIEKANGPIKIEPQPGIGPETDRVQLPKNQPQAHAVFQKKMRFNFVKDIR